MSAAYEVAHWVDFGVGLIGAAAALLGLLFVAISINLDHILLHALLPRLAGVALVLLTEPVLVALVLMTPGQTADSVGIECIGIGLLIAALLFRPLVRSGEHAEFVPWVIQKLLPEAAATLGLVYSGVSLIMDHGGGLYVMVGAVAASIIAGLMGAWVLLVEIQR